MRRFAAATAISAVALCACQNGTVTLSVADAPIDGASQVQILFTGVDLVASNGDKHSFDLNPDRPVNLLSSTSTTPLLNTVTVSAGDYKQIILRISADGSGSDSFLIYPATATANQQTFPLKLSDTDANAADGIAVPADFTVTRLRNTAITADIDLRRAIINANQGSPPLTLDLGGSLTNNSTGTNVRVVTNTDVGTISGTIAADLLTSTNCSPAAVYVYQNNVTTPDDVGSATPPFASTTVPVVTSTNASLSYSVDLLPPGTYTVALICRADEDDPTKDDNITVLRTQQNVQVSAGQITTVAAFQ